jgi:serine/threonine-protein kinase
LNGAGAPPRSGTAAESGSRPRAIGRYTILREIRRGRISATYVVADPVLNRELTVKAVVLGAQSSRGSPDERRQVEQAFMRQAQAAGRLQHPHILAVLDAGMTHAYGFLVIERPAGRTLAELLGSGRPSPARCAAIVARIADALAFAHANGIAHGHLAAEDILVQGNGMPRISGFGGWIDQGEGGDEALLDTARLLPYFQNELTVERRQQDLRALGLLLYRMLGGRAASAGDARASEPLTLARPDLPPALAILVDDLVLGAPGRGPQSAAALRDALGAWLWNQGADGPATASLGLPPTPRPRPPAVHETTFVPDDVHPPPRLEALAAGAQPAQEGPPAQALPPLTVPNPLGHLFERLLGPLRPWAVENRIALSAAGALLSLAIFLGLVLGNLSHPESNPESGVPGSPGAAEPIAAARPATPAGSATSRAANSARVALPLDIQPWGEVLVDGRPAGVSPPLARIEVSPGPHLVEVRHGSSAPWVAHIEVPAGPGPAPALRHRFP